MSHPNEKGSEVADSGFEHQTFGPLNCCLCGSVGLVYHRAGLFGAADFA